MADAKCDGHANGLGIDGMGQRPDFVSGLGTLSKFNFRCTMRRRPIMASGDVLGLHDLMELVGTDNELNAVSSLHSELASTVDIMIRHVIERTASGYVFEGDDD